MTDGTDPVRPRFVQDLFDADTRPVPAALRWESTADLGLDDVPVERYVSVEHHRLEVERVWKRCWQMACRSEHLVEVGDVVVYDIGDVSLLVVRSEPGRVRAFVNSCLHRGTQLRADDGHVDCLRCPFHGFTWSLDGDLVSIPADWDFPHVDSVGYSLPEVPAAEWQGFVFVNPDPEAGPLEEYLGGMVEHLADWSLADRYVTADVAKVIDCNWKVALEAFIEAYHTFSVHPQLFATSGDIQTQYDVDATEPHWSRMITPVGISSELAGDRYSENEIATALLNRPPDTEIVPDGERARPVVADRVRAGLTKRTGRDWSGLSDAEALDGIEYYVFPNFVPWVGIMTPLVYRFRPHGDDPNRSLLEVMLLDPVPADRPRPAPAPRRVLGEDESLGSVPELGYLGQILDQDLATMPLVQRGLRASTKPGVTFSRYQESRLRHYHQTLEAYLDGVPPGRS